MAVIYSKLFLHELKYPFSISRYTKTHQSALLIRYERNGIRGYGECTTNAYYRFDVQEAKAKLDLIKGHLEADRFDDPSDFWLAAKELGCHSFLLCALDEAYWDWYGKSLNRSTRSLLGISADSCPMTSYTIGIDQISVMQQKIEKFPWPLYKVKLGSEHDIDFVRDILAIAKAPICIDANASWTQQQVIDIADALSAEELIFIEQPMHRDAWQEMAQVKSVSSIPLIADESCMTESDILACTKSFDGINIKLMKCGGITPAIPMIRRARSEGLLVMLGCMTECSVGISAAAQLAPWVDIVDLDGNLLIVDDPALGIRWTAQGIVWPERAGNGVMMREQYRF